MKRRAFLSTFGSFLVSGALSAYFILRYDRSIMTKSGSEGTSGYSIVISLGELGSSTITAPFAGFLSPAFAAEAPLTSGFLPATILG